MTISLDKFRAAAQQLVDADVDEPLRLREFDNGVARKPYQRFWVQVCDLFRGSETIKQKKAETWDLFITQTKQKYSDGIYSEQIDQVATTPLHSRAIVELFKQLDSLKPGNTGEDNTQSPLPPALPATSDIESIIATRSSNASDNPSRAPQLQTREIPKTSVHGADFAANPIDDNGIPRNINDTAPAIITETLAAAKNAALQAGVAQDTVNELDRRYTLPLENSPPTPEIRTLLTSMKNAVHDATYAQKSGANPLSAQEDHAQCIALCKETALGVFSALINPSLYAKFREKNPIDDTVNALLTPSSSQATKFDITAFNALEAGIIAKNKHHLLMSEEMFGVRNKLVEEIQNGAAEIAQRSQVPAKKEGTGKPVPLVLSDRATSPTIPAWRNVLLPYFNAANCHPSDFEHFSHLCFRRWQEANDK